MKVCNTASCESCNSYGSQSFKVMEYSIGKMINIPNKDTDCLLYILSGKLSIIPNDAEEYILETNRILLLIRNQKYSIEILEDTKILVHTFVTSYQVCDRMTLKDVKHILDSIQYKFYSIEIKEPMKMILDTILYYLKDNINCCYWQRAKNLDFFVIYWNYYTLDEICNFFYPIINKDICFHTKVMANFTKAKTVTELAKLCGYSLPTFNKLFAEHFQNISPYQWMLQQNASLIKARLFDKTVPIKNIVAEFGFIDQSYFNKFCKRFFGGTALQVRKGIN